MPRWFGGFIQTPEDDPEELDHDLLNPATGPIFVEGAEPGDVLAVELLHIEVGEQGSAPLYPGEFGFLKDDPIGAFTKIAAVENGVIVYRDDMRIPVQPMLGTLGVAPAGKPVSNLYMGDHGANMDHKDVCVGNTVYLPVFVRARWSRWRRSCDHRRRGDGRRRGSRSSVVTLRVRVSRGRRSHAP